MKPITHSLTLRQKIFLSAGLSLILLIAGILFQSDYHARKEAYTLAITGYYREYFRREPDAAGLQHWVTWALNKWGLEKVKQRAFIEVTEKEGRA